MISAARAKRLERSWDEWHQAQPEETVREIQTLRTQYRVSDFVSWQRDKALELNPNFQRRPVWKKGAKSYLIDTILRGLPMPIIFLRDLRADLKTFKSKRDVVDGQQRIRTILSFVNPNLLDDFDKSRDDFSISATHNKSLGGKKFRDLSSVDQQKVLDYQFSVHSFAADTDDREILQIFARMNSTGVGLNAQELRNAEFYGPFKQTAYEIATEQLNRWRDWRIFSPDAIARMNEVEITSEFMMLMLNGTLEKSKIIIDKIYETYEHEFSEVAEITSRFQLIFETIESLFSLEEITTYFKNRSMFYALFATLYGLQYGLRNPKEKYKKLKKIKPITIKPIVAKHILTAGKAIADQTAPDAVLKSLRGATTHAGERRSVIGYLAGKGNDPWQSPN